MKKRKCLSDSYSIIYKNIYYSIEPNNQHSENDFDKMTK